jgi:putative ABC transport system permease protein
VAVASLALGIGANTAILAVMNTVMRERVSYATDARLVVARTHPEENPQRETHASIAEYFAWRDHSRSFEGMSASLGNQADFGADSERVPAERIQGQATTATLFGLLGVQPALGRVFTEAEDAVRAPDRVIVLSHRLWQRRFGGDAGVLGKEVRMNAVVARIIGVMPEGFHYPNDGVEYWVPLRADRSQVSSPERFFVVTARLKEGVDATQAQAELNTIAAQLARDRPGRHAGWAVRVKALRQVMYGWTFEPLFTLAAAVAMVLLVACANVAGLLFARGLVRKPEMALRAALGAGRGRIVRQLLTESVVLAAAGGVLGVFVAWGGVRALLSIGPPPGGMRIADVGLGASVLAVSALLSLGTVLLFGLAPALIASRTDLAGPLEESTRKTTARLQPRLRAGLVAGQIAVTFVLLIGSGLLIQSFVRLVTRDLNFDPRGLLTFEIHLPISTYMRPIGAIHGLPYFEISPHASLTMQRVYEGLRQLPAAESVAGISYPPVNSLTLPTMTVAPEPHPAGGADPSPSVPLDVVTLADHVSRRSADSVAYFLVTPRFFSTMRATLVRGRDFDTGDTASAPWVAIVNESTARRFWPGEDPIGKRFRLQALPDERPREVIGVVRDIPLSLSEASASSVVYTSYLQQPPRYRLPGANMFGRMTFLIRSTGDPMQLLPAARQVVADIDRDRPLANVRTMDEQRVSSIPQRPAYVAVLSAFALTATLLAAIGIYGVMAYSVAQRTREIGVRIALGAGTRDVAALVGRRAAVLVSIGLAAGLAASLAVTRLLGSQLWGVTPTDPATYGGVMAFLLLVSLAACCLPTRRATTVNPTIALRCE